MSGFSKDEREELLSYYFSTLAAIDEVAGSSDIGPEQVEKFRKLTADLSELKAHYRAGVPVVALSRCPISHDVVQHSLDIHGLDGPWWDYANPIRPMENLPPTCLAVTGAVHPREPLEQIAFTCKPGAAAPYVLPRLLNEPQIWAVLSYVAIGRHHGFAIVYYTKALAPMEFPRIDTWGTDHYFVEDEQGDLYKTSLPLDPGQADFDIGRWIAAKKLFWIAPDDPSLVIQAGLENCPYLDIARGPGFYRIYNGEIWSEEPPRVQPPPTPGQRTKTSKSPQAPVDDPAPVRDFAIYGLLRAIADAQDNVTPQHLHALAVGLRSARDEKRLPEETLRAVHRVLQAQAADGSSWTVGLGSLQWKRLSNGEWQTAKAPDRLSLGPKILQHIAVLTREPVAPPPKAAQVQKTSKAADKKAAAAKAKVKPPTPSQSKGEAKKQPTSQPTNGAARGFALTQRDLKRLLRRVHYAMGQASEPSANGVLMVIEPGALTFVATDRHRLALAKLSMKTAAPKPREVGIPRNTVLKLMEILGESDDFVEIDLSDGIVRFRLAQGVLESRFLEGTFPAYRHVMPKITGSGVSIRREELIRSLETAASRSDASPARVFWMLTPKKLTLSGGRDRPKEEIKVAYSGETLQTAFNPNYMLDALRHLDSKEVEIRSTSSTNPSVLTIPGQSDFQYVLMPVRA